MTGEILTPDQTRIKTQYWSEHLSGVGSQEPKLEVPEVAQLITDIVKIRRAVGLNKSIESLFSRIPTQELMMDLWMDDNIAQAAHLTAWDPRVEEEKRVTEQWDFIPGDATHPGKIRVGSAYVSPVLGELIHGNNIPTVEMRLSHASRLVIARTTWKGHLENEAPMLEYVKAFFTPSV